MQFLHCLALLVADALEACLQLKSATDPLGIEPITTSFDPLPLEVHWGDSDVEVLFATVEVLKRSEGTVFVAEVLQCLLNFMDALLPADVLAKGVRDDQMDDLVLQRIQSVDQVELPLESGNVVTSHVAADRLRPLLMYVGEAVEGTATLDDFENHGGPARPRRTSSRVAWSAASWPLRSSGSRLKESVSPSQAAFRARAIWFRLLPIFPSWP